MAEGHGSAVHVHDLRVDVRPLRDARERLGVTEEKPDTSEAVEE